MATAPDTDKALEATPNVERLLGALGKRLTALVLLYGLGTVLGVVSLWIAFAYFADWGLRVPKVVRIAHGLVLVVLLAVFLWRSVLRPLRRIPGRSGLALLLERAHPDLRELLISAVQFQAAPTAGSDDATQGDPELIRRVLGDADARAAALTARGILDPRAPRTRFLLGTLAALGVAAFAAAKPDHARILVDRMLGGSRSWPQATHLAVELPGLDETAVARAATEDGTGRSEDSEETIRARVARGTDVAIVVRAEGVIPDEVRLAFEGGRDLVLARGAGNTFRTMLRSCQEDVAFHATGGDDQDGLPRVEIEVLQPPDVEGIAYRVVPPAYSGQPEWVTFDHDVQVLEGSELRVHVRPAPEDATGRARILPEDRVVDLETAEFPAPAPSDVVLEPPARAGVRPRGDPLGRLPDRAPGRERALQPRPRPLPHRRQGGPRSGDPGARAVALGVRDRPRRRHPPARSGGRRHRPARDDVGDPRRRGP